MEGVVPENEEIQENVICHSAVTPDGDYNMNTDETETTFIERPESLNGVKKAFAVEINNDDCSPRFHRGECVYVHTACAHAPKDDIFILFKTGLGRIRQFIRKETGDTPEKHVLVAHQYNPPKECRFLYGDIEGIYRIIEMRRRHHRSFPRE